MKRGQKPCDESKRALIKNTQAEVRAAIQKVNESISLLPQAAQRTRKDSHGAREFMDAIVGQTGESGASNPAETGQAYLTCATRQSSNSNPIKAEPLPREHRGQYVELPKQYRGGQAYESQNDGAQYIQLGKDQYVAGSHAGSFQGQQAMNRQASQSQTTIAQSNMQNSQPSSRLSRSRKGAGSDPAGEQTQRPLAWQPGKSQERTEQVLRKAREQASRSREGYSRSQERVDPEDKSDRRYIRSLNTKNLNQQSRSSLQKESGKGRAAKEGKVDKSKGRKKQKAEKQGEFKKLMDLQVRQAQMLMDLQQQYIKGQDSSRQSEGLSAGLDSQQLAVEDLSGRNHQRLGAPPSQQSSKSNLSATQRSTMGLIQAIYRQMEKINTQLSRKEQIEQERFAEMERKMKKLQKKYAKIREQNLNEQTQSQGTQPLSRSQAHSSSSAAHGSDFASSHQFRGLTESRARAQKSTAYEQPSGNARDQEAATVFGVRQAGDEPHRLSAQSDLVLCQGKSLQAVTSRPDQDGSDRGAFCTYQSKLAQLEEGLSCHLAQDGQPEIQVVQNSAESCLDNSARQNSPKLTSQYSPRKDGQIREHCIVGAGIRENSYKIDEKNSQQSLMINEFGLGNPLRIEKQGGERTETTPKESKASRPASRNSGARLFPLIAERKPEAGYAKGEVLSEQEQRLQSEDPLSQTTTDEPTALEALNAPNPFPSDVTKSQDQRQLLEKVQYKLHTIQSIINGSEGSSLGGLPPGTTTSLGGRANLLSNCVNSIEQLAIQTPQLAQKSGDSELAMRAYTQGATLSEGQLGRDQPACSPDLEKQLQTMNKAVAQLKVDQVTQLSQMKEFYESQMNQFREECAPRKEPENLEEDNVPQTAEITKVEEVTVQEQTTQNLKAGTSAEEVAAQVLQKLMDQGQFQDTLSQLSQAVNQKDKLEQRLWRIKEKLQRAKNIRSDPSLSDPPSGSGTTGPPTPLEASQDRQLPGDFAIPYNGVEERSHATALTSIPGPEAASSLTHLPPRGPAQSQRLAPSAPQAYHHKSSQQSSATASHQASHKLLEVPSPKDPSQLEARDSRMTAGGIDRLGSDEEFAKRLNYQYVSRDLRPKQTEAPQGLQGSRSQYIPNGQAPVSDSRFLQPFRPTQSVHQPINTESQASVLEGPNNGAISEIYLRDTSHSMLQIDLNTDSRQEILQDEKKGVYQKIVDLQLLQLRKDASNRAPIKEGHHWIPQPHVASSALFVSAQGNQTPQNCPDQASGGSLSEALCSNRDFSKPFNPSRDSGSKRRSAEGHQQVLSHIANLESIQQNYLTGAPAPLQNQFGEQTRATEAMGNAKQSSLNLAKRAVHIAPGVSGGLPSQKTSDYEHRIGASRLEQKLETQQRRKLAAEGHIYESSTATVAQHVGLSSKFANPGQQNTSPQLDYGEEASREFEMQSEQSVPASASSERSRLRNIIQDGGFNKADIFTSNFASSTSNTFAEKRAYASGDQQYGQRGSNGAGRDFETREFSAAFQSREDQHPHRDENEETTNNQDYNASQERPHIDYTFKKVLDQEKSQIYSVPEEAMSRGSTFYQPQSHLGDTFSSNHNDTQEIQLNNYDEVIGKHRPSHFANQHN